LTALTEADVRDLVERVRAAELPTSIEALEQVRQLQLHFSRLLEAGTRESATTTTGAEALTSREREVLRVVALGHTNVEVAASLSIAAGTVRKHLEHAYAKLGVSTRTAAVAAVFELFPLT
jgi:DNA-binding NarL/FixJ family response regulator